MARLGFFGRIGRAVGRLAERIGDIFTPGEPRRAPAKPQEPPRAPSGPTPRGGPPRGARDRQRAREADPYLRAWNTLSNRPGYLGHLDFFNDKIVGEMDLDQEERFNLWQDYIRYMTTTNHGYRLNSLNNPFWGISGMHPDDFDWWGWRDAMGYSHGNRSR